MQESLTFPTLGSPPRFTFPELRHDRHESWCSELSSSTSTPFVSAPSSPSRMKGFYFSAPTSPIWNQQQQAQSRYGAQQQEMEMDSSCQSINMWSHKRQVSHESLQPHSDSSTWTPKSPQGEHFAIQSWAPKAQHNGTSPSLQNSAQTESDRSSNLMQRPLQTHHTSSSSWSPMSLHSKLEEGSNCTQQPLQTGHDSSSRPHQTCVQTSSLHNNAAASHTAVKRLQVEDLDLSYSRKGFYASAVPFAWEEKPGTPKARSIASEASNGEDDTASILLSGSSDFEFSARFAELEEPPMSPTPIAYSSSSFKQHVAAYGSPSPSYKSPSASNHTQAEEQIWPLRPPPRLDHPVLPMKQLIKDDASEHGRSYGSLSSLSAPQSPRSPRRFDLRGVLCGISSPADAVFDPFLVAMEKTMGKDRDEFACEMGNMAKNVATRGVPHHRRTRSSSPLRVFHWDDHSTRSTSSSNGSSTMDDVKSKHPIQREIDARHNAAIPKGSKRWSFRGFLHRKSESGGESARHSNMRLSLRSSGSESNMSSTSRRESCSSSAMGEVSVDMSNYGDDMNAMKMKGISSPASIISSPVQPCMPSTPPSILSPSSSSSSSKGKLSAQQKANYKGPYALHYGMQRSHREELRKKTFLPYKQGLLGCLGLSSKSYRAIATLSKPLQSVS